LGETGILRPGEVVIWRSIWRSHDLPIYLAIYLAIYLVSWRTGRLM
jgi:hypothetical protein